jgi:transducin (beta)-like 1
MQNGSPAELPARRGKGKRKSGGNERRVNGDAMEIDGGGMTGPGTNEVSVADAESPLPIIEELPPISTLEIGESKGTITEKPRDLTATTAFIGLDEGLLLELVTWSPHNRTALVTAGKNHMQVFKVGTNELPENDTYTRSTKVDIASDEFEVQAFCWTEKGSGAFTTLERFTNEDGDEMMTYKMLGFTDYGHKVSLVDTTAGWVLSLKYQNESEMLISLSWGEQSHIKIWQYSETIYENSKRRVEPRYELKCSKTMDSGLLAVEWTSPNRFMVCGEGTITLYEVSDDIQLIHSVPTAKTWPRLIVDPTHYIAVTMVESFQMLTVIHMEGDKFDVYSQTFRYGITDLAFQPLDSKPTIEDPYPNTILAISSDSGEVYLYKTVTGSLTPLQPLHRLEMGYDAIAQCLSFSPDGYLLAAAGYDTLNVWKTLEGSQPKGVWRIPSGTDERWKSEEGEDGEGEGDRFVHKLGWDSDGKRIAFGMNGQVAVIRL